VDWKEIDRIRVPGFAMARRGYDRHEVDRFLNRLADWLETDAPNEIGQMAVTRKLELVGKSASHILLTTEQESEEMKRRAKEESAQVREDAQAASRQTRGAADEYAKKTRAKAEEDARRIADNAAASATKTVEAGERRREAIEAVVAELTERRDQTLRELERLQGELGTTIGKHRGGPRTTKRKAPAAVAPQADAEPAPAPGEPPKPVKPAPRSTRESAGAPS
jgi:DivIVA domain-containing protein